MNSIWMKRRWIGLLLATLVAIGGLAGTTWADDAPKPDPAGTSTGAAGDATGFAVAAPAALIADDQKDPAKVKAYGEAKAAYDAYVAQTKAEPLAVKLAGRVF